MLTFISNVLSLMRQFESVQASVVPREFQSYRPTVRRVRAPAVAPFNAMRDGVAGDVGAVLETHPADALSVDVGDADSHRRAVGEAGIDRELRRVRKQKRWRAERSVFSSG